MCTISTAIADYLEEHYPDRPTLFGGPAGRSLARFVQNWTETVLQTGLVGLVVLDIYRHIRAEDRAYFRSSREERFGRTLEEVVEDREARLPAFRASLDPLRRTVERQNFRLAAMRRPMPTTSCSAPSSGLARSANSNCWRPVTRCGRGVAGCSTCMAASPATHRPTAD